MNNTFKLKQKLVQIHSAIDQAMGDTDPDTQGMTDEEIRYEEPLFWAAKEIAKLIGKCPWDKYLEKPQEAVDA